MTALVDSAQASTSRRRAQAALRFVLAVCLGLLAGSCNQGLNAPFVKLTLSNLPPTTTRLEVDLTLGSTMKMPTSVFTGTASTLGDVTISFPADSRGILFIAVRAIDDMPCIVGLGSIAVNLDGNQVFAALIIPMAPAMGCQNPESKNALMVTLAGDGKGTVTSADTMINCGTACSELLKASSSVTLTATPAAAPPGSTYVFVGWSSSDATFSCTTNPQCPFQLNASTLTVTATFRCSGLCPETPAGQTGDLYGIWGFSTTGKPVVAVGAAGTILQKNGTTWTKVNSTTGTTLRAVSGAPSSIVGFAVGDNGVIVNTMDGGATWGAQTSPTTRILRTVVLPSTVFAYATGDNPQMDTMPYLSFSSMGWQLASAGGLSGSNLNGMFMFDAFTFYIVGSNGKTAWVSTSDLTSIHFLFPGPVGADLNAVWGVPPSTLFAVGKNSTIVTFDKTTATTGSVMQAPVAGITMHAITGFGTSPAPLFAVGDGGNIWQFDGTMWKTVANSAGSTNLYGIWGTSPQDYYVVGQNGLILHNRP